MLHVGLVVRGDGREAAYDGVVDVRASSAARASRRAFVLIDAASSAAVAAVAAASAVGDSLGRLLVDVSASSPSAFRAFAMASSATLFRVEGRRIFSVAGRF